MAELLMPPHTPHRRRARTPDPSLLATPQRRQRAHTPEPSSGVPSEYRRRARTLEPPRRTPSPHRHRGYTPEPPRVLTPERHRECTPEEGLRIPSPHRDGRECTPEPTGPVVESITYGGELFYPVHALWVGLRTCKFEH